jgi:hypothetical protein
MYQDVREGETPFYIHIIELSNLWIVEWHSDWDFRPQDPVTRGEMCKMINKLRKLMMT